MRNISIKSNKRGKIDKPFLYITLILLFIGVVMVFSASYSRAYYTKQNAGYYFFRQLSFAFIGLLSMYLLSKVPVSVYKKLSVFVLIFSLASLAVVPHFGIEENGARRWLSLGFTTFQPSEIAKISVILSFSSLICRFKGKMKTFKYGVLPFAIILFLIIALLVLEPHFSAAIIIILLGATMLFLGGTGLIWFFLGFCVAAGGLYLATRYFPYVAERIHVWRDPFGFADGRGYQIVQSLYAIGSGGLSGLGLGNGRQKLHYLPEEHNDFIFSVVCEELGLVGASVIIILFALLIIRGFWLALHMKNRYSFLVVSGIMTLLSIQVIMNIAVVTNLIPCTGISLPFFSYGGTALVIQISQIGIVLSASKELVSQNECEGD